MARAATTSDVFNAIAEPRRREIIELLAGGRDRPVGELVGRLGLAQPAVSKHLGVLRRVGLVAVHKQGQQRVYSLRPGELKPVHEWVRNFERFWADHLDNIKLRAERTARERAAAVSATQHKPNPPTEKEKP